MASLINLTPTTIISRLTTIFKPKSNILNADWVAFQHGTFVVSNSDAFTTRDELINNAKQSLAYYRGGLRVGSSGADFSSNPQDRYFPEESVWVISFDSQDVMTLVMMEGKGYDGPGMSLKAGLLGRDKRNQDAEEMVVVGSSRDE
ncbi:hypothetical protein HDV00_000196 [Rhizophlyctis rosea]|nr:hypothetical protein HDV00_000196 [Rhizophlyctis rosea]